MELLVLWSGFISFIHYSFIHSFIIHYSFIHYSFIPFIYLFIYLLGETDVSCQQHLCLLMSDLTDRLIPLEKDHLYVYLENCIIPSDHLHCLSLILPMDA